METYLVQNIYELPLAYGEFHLVKAKNKKEAIDLVYDIYQDEFNKKDFKATNVEDLFREEGQVVEL